jgi:competence protein ComEC
MYSSLIIANNLGRKVHFLQSLSLAGIIILLFQPCSLFLIGFQLSFLATWAILALYYYHLKERLDFFPKLRIFPSKYEKWKQNLFTLSLVSFIAWVATAPLILYYFNRFQPIAIIANILLTIFSLWYTLGLSFVLLIFIILTKVASIFSLFLPLLAVLLYFSINFLLFILHSLLYFKWSWYLPTPSPLLVFIPYIFLLYFLVKRAKLLLISGLLLINLILLDFMYKQHNILFCHFFSLVRNRESTFISLPRREGANFWENNINLLINCGDENTVKYLLLPYFEKRGIKELTALFLSNNRNDHAGGYKLLLENIKIKALFHNGGIKLDNTNIPNFILKKGDVVKIGKHLRIAVYNPEFYPQHKREDVNSLVLKLNYCTQDKSRNIYLLFPGAIPPFLQRQIILENNDLFPVDISYLPHHGRHISQEWLKKSKREAKLVISKFPSFDNNIKCTQKDSLRIGIDVGTGELISNPPFSLYILGKIIKG